MTRDDVYQIIDAERDHQDAKWGTVREHPHEVGGWLLIVEQLLADARLAWTSRRGDAGALDELRKAVAVGVACLEQHGCPQRRP